MGESKLDLLQGTLDVMVPSGCCSDSGDQRSNDPELMGRPG
jgi:hypothetical protein